MRGELWTELPSIELSIPNELNVEYPLQFALGPNTVRLPEPTPEGSKKVARVSSVN